MAHRRWRQASGEEAARQAHAILLEHAHQESEGMTDFDSQLAELARALEALPRPARLAPRGTEEDSPGTLRTGSPSSSGGAADSELAAEP